ncbi:hypothetical protein [Spirosoma foliorum]|uniref:PepSY domain-containing protein n=1 Tax=Spirosoma foliorum TaxID=2710596 RepID=A0A7G5GUV6_9BACT|nr:hypothetical protein [Spirosoma foliorum]QMW02648.1 hypothetical protein H3H32_32885 [Spirosoma foliorum]
MKRIILSAALLATMTFACQNDKVDQVSPPSTLGNLSADELAVSSSIGRLGSSSEAFSQATAYQKANPTSTVAVTVDRSTVEAILGQSHTVGIRAYFIKNSEGKLDLALVGMDKDLNNRYLTNAMFSEGKTISEENFKKKLTLFQSENPIAIRAVAFGSQILLDRLNQTNSTGLRFYFTIDKDGNRNLMFVGIDRQSKDLLNDNPNARTTDDDAGTGGMPCPQHCGNNG